MFEIDPDKVCFVVMKAREFDVKVDVVEPDPGSNPADGDMREVLEDYADDPTYQEVKGFIDDMNYDDQVDLVALAWMGRGDFSKDEWADARKQAAEAHNEHTGDYLLGMPILSDYLEEALSQFGHTCEDFEFGHL